MDGALAGEGDAGSSSSGVRPRLPSFESVRLLLIEPDATRRDALAQRAREMAVPLQIASSPVTALTLRAQSSIDLVACAFPVRGAEGLVRTLHRERFPVVVITDDVQRAIAAFGLDVPVLRGPLDLAVLFRHALEQLGRL